ncbi:MAG: metal-dependent hydrolase [Firmicutes bacterium]|nr:metal-dependent hydrolase [Bacillota bacterium]
MKGKTHLMIGSAAGATVAAEYNLEVGLILICSSAFGSLVPDADHPKSMLNQKILPIKNKMFKMIIYLIMGLGLIYLDSTSNKNFLRLMAIALIITALSHHRGFTHSIFGLLFYSTAVYTGLKNYNLSGAYIGFVIGYASHLIADFITTGGIELLYPWEKNIKLPAGIKTGGFIENIILISSSVYFLIKVMDVVRL